MIHYNNLKIIHYAFIDIDLMRKKSLRKFNDIQKQDLAALESKG